MQDPFPAAEDRPPAQEQPAFGKGEQIAFGKEMSPWVKLLNIAVLGVLVICAAGFVWLMSSLPRIEGRVPVKGLELPASVARDPSGVPHVTARSVRDAYFAMGWVHAQDRLWQMEVQRRVGAGRLAEVVGEAGLSSDRFMRTLGIYRLAQAEFEGLDRPTRDALTAYAEGVNAWLRDYWHRLPPEFLALGVRPEPWTPADSLVWGRLMALQLANDWRDELLRAKLAGRLDPRRLRDLWPDLPAESPVTLGAAGADSLLAAIPETALPHLASNVWAVGGSRTASGKPLLANDPHLGFRAPILWYLMSVEAPGLTLTGAMVPGVPFHLIGHNGRVAWGITSSYADTVDLFLEKPLDADTYQGPDGPLPFERRQEVIKVKGKPDVVLTVRATRHGPVISDLPGFAPDQLVAFRATALEPDNLTSQALHRLNRAVDWRGFSAALRDVTAPTLNFAFADTGGTIAFATAGRVPLRKGGDGSRPAEGWTRQGEWAGWIPPDRMPQAVNPKSDRLVNANNRIAAGRNAPPLATSWPDGYRAQRIEELIGAKPKLTLDDMAAMQLDHLSLEALEIKDLLDVGGETTPQGRQAANMVAAWDGSAGRDRPEPLIFAAWVEQVWHDVLADELGADFKDFATVRPQVLTGILTSRRHWCDDVATPEPESCDEVVARALDKAVAALAARHGPDIAAWKWGDEHKAVFEHPVLSRVPLLNRIANAEIATDGDDFTVNRGTYLPGGFRHVHGAGLRAVYDLSDLSASRFIIATGQSGNPLSRHYDDLLEAWRDNHGLAIGRRPEGGAVLRLEPGY